MELGPEQHDIADAVKLSSRLGCLTVALAERTHGARSFCQHPGGLILYAPGYFDLVLEVLKGWFALLNLGDEASAHLNVGSRALGPLYSERCIAAGGLALLGLPLRCGAFLPCCFGLTRVLLSAPVLIQVPQLALQPREALHLGGA